MSRARFSVQIQQRHRRAAQKESNWINASTLRCSIGDALSYAVSGGDSEGVE
jgi:hypothetical protein